MSNVFNRCFFSKPFYASIKKTFKYHLRKNYSCIEMDNIKLYEDRVITLSSFLLISSAFMLKNVNEEPLDYDWQSYISSFSPEHIRTFLLCSIRYLIDIKYIDKFECIFDKDELKDSFEEQYTSFISSRYKKKKKKKFDDELDMNKYKELLDLVLKIHVIYHEEMPNDKSKVIDLVKNTSKWKIQMFELFNHRAEYILFSFFVNLRS